MDHIVHLANSYLLRRGIARLPLETETLFALCEQEGYELLSYAEADAVIDRLGLGAHKQRDAFLYAHQGLRLLFYEDRLSYAKKRFAIAHELGHIALMHLYSGVISKSDAHRPSSRQEQEADVFAYQLLAPICILRKAGAHTVRAVQELTLCDREQAEHVLGLLSEPCQKSASDRALTEAFRPFLAAAKRSRCRGLCACLCLLEVLLTTLFLCLALSHCTGATKDPRAAPLRTVTELSPISRAPQSGGLFYWSQGGEVYHAARDCPALSRTGSVSSGSKEEAEAAGKGRPCQICGD